jgi:hypothetical protein
MPTGNIIHLSFIHQSGLDSRTTDTSMMQFSTRNYIVDAGLVYSHSKFLVVWLWNGTYSDTTITEVIENLTGGILVSGLTQYDIIPARSSVRVILEVTKYGATAFTSTFQFISPCSSDPILSISGSRVLISLDQPRPITMTEAMEEAYAYAEPTDTFYDTLEFYCGITNDYVRVVCSDEELITPQGTFAPCYFGFELPETQGSVRGQMKINVDFLPREAQVWIRTATQSRGKITVTWRQYLGPGLEPDAWYPIPLEIMTVEQTPTGVTATALFPDLVNIPFPRRIMTTTELPGGII